MKLYVYGASSFGTEVAWHVRNSNLRDYEFGGFICGETYVEPEFDENYVGDIDILRPGDSVVLAVGRNIEFKVKLVKELIERGIEFPNMVSDKSIVSEPQRQKLMKNEVQGNLVFPLVIISTGASIGDFNLINSYAGLGHETCVGNFNTVSSYCHLMGFSSIGDRNHLGGGATLLPRASIGNDNLVSPGSYIYKRFNNGERIAGNPALRV